MGDFVWAPVREKMLVVHIDRKAEMLQVIVRDRID